MKKIILAAAAVVCAISASAQSSLTFWDGEKAEQKIVISPRVGLNISSMSFDKVDDEGSKSKIGFDLGVAVEFPIVKSFYINSGLFYTTKGVKFEEDGYKQTWNGGFLELPVYASYRLNFAENSQLQINFGPYFAYGVNGKITAEYKGYKEKYDLFGTSTDDEDKGGIKRFDCGLGIGAGYVWNRIYLGVNYQFGLVNLLDKDQYGDKASAKNSNFNISVGYNF